MIETSLRPDCIIHSRLENRIPLIEKVATTLHKANLRDAAEQFVKHALEIESRTLLLEFCEQFVTLQISSDK